MSKHPEKADYTENAETGEQGDAGVVESMVGTMSEREAAQTGQEIGEVVKDKSWLSLGVTHEREAGDVDEADGKGAASQEQQEVPDWLDNNGL